MSLSIITLFIRLIIGIGLGFLAARKSKKTLQLLITHLTPLKYRMTERFYQKQARFVAIGGILIILLITFLSHQALWNIQQRIPVLTTTQVSTANTFPSSNPSPIEPVYEEEEIVELETAIESPPPRASEPKLPATSKIPVAYQTETEVVLPLKTIYLQIGAFQSRENALNYYTRWQNQSTFGIHIKIIEDHAPYKVLIGPFESEREARRAKQQLRTTAFLRSVPI